MRKRTVARKRGLGETLVLFGFPGVFVVAGIILLWAGTAEWRHARASASWPTAPGVVEKSYVTIHRRTRHVHIVYSYEVQATPYRSDRVAFGSHSPAAGRRWLREYPVGASVTVHFDPRDPSTTVLEPRLVEGNWVMPSGMMPKRLGASLASSYPRSFSVLTRIRKRGRLSLQAQENEVLTPCAPRPLRPQ